MAVTGVKIYRNLNVGTTAAQIQTGAQHIMGWFIHNQATSTRYVKFYDQAATPVVGTDTPVMTIPIPAGPAAANVEWKRGIPFNVKCWIAATTLVADNDASAPSSNDVVANIFTLHG